MEHRTEVASWVEEAVTWVQSKGVQREDLYPSISARAVQIQVERIVQGDRRGSEGTVSGGASGYARECQ